MSQPNQSWQSVQKEVLRRIRERVWQPGQRIPDEADLAREFGCARATVNRALREIADSGFLERRRRAGTRVALHPVRKATLAIPVLRLEIEGRGESYSLRLLERSVALPPDPLRRLFAQADEPILHVKCLHCGDGRPYAIEDRWIDTRVVPAAGAADFSKVSPNEWLVLNVPFEGGDISFSAASAEPQEAEILGCAPGAAVFLIDRTTWRERRTLTSVRLTFAPGYRVHTVI